MKMKNNFCNWCQYEIQKTWDRGENKAYKTFVSRVQEGNIQNTIYYVELFMTTMKMKNNYYNWCEYEMQKSRDGGGNKTYKIFTSQVVEANIPNTISHMQLLITMKMKNNYCMYEM